MMRERWLIPLALVAVAVFAVDPALSQTPAAAAKPPAMKHAAAGRDNCLMCHARGVMEPVPDVPENHADRPVEACQWCHAPDAAMQTKTAQPMKHAAAGREKCMMCHNPGVMEAVPDVPADHKGRAEKLCGLCHQAAAKE
ncbi:MAG: hypothetical protein HY337_06790 [Gemmatimonadetes bacterium]|nr:hypothetical protein [Gemmatimonadota bacterium]